jgi:hypothetical protein
MKFILIYFRGGGASLVTLEVEICWASMVFSYPGGLQFEFLGETDYSDVFVIFLSLLPPTHLHFPFRSINVCSEWVKG